MTQHVMLDIETLGTKPGSIILSIGACTFEPHGGGVNDAFYTNVCPTDSRDNYGLRSDPSTVEWWKNQSVEAKAHLTSNRRVLPLALSEFAKWFEDVGGEQVWCQGATFDVPLMEAAYSAVKQHTPWKFWNVRDTRTVYDVFGFDAKSVERAGTYHNALDDARHQVKCVQGALRCLT